MVVRPVNSVAEYHELLEDAQKADVPVLLDAFAVWCAPCKAIAPMVEKLSETEQLKDDVWFAKFDVDQVPELAQTLGIRAMPTFKLLYKRDEIGELIGANPAGFSRLLDPFSGRKAEAKAEAGVETAPTTPKE